MGLIYLIGYILVVGFGTFLMKFAHKDITSAQINFIIAISMLIITAPVLWLTQRSWTLPSKGLAVAGLSGICMAVGSIFFVAALAKVEVGPASAIASGYIVFALMLSMIFLKEPLTALKAIGMVLTLTGIVILSLKAT
jgi:uncharacterized membrane protein